VKSGVREVSEARRCIFNLADRCVVRENISQFIEESALFRSIQSLSEMPQLQAVLNALNQSFTSLNPFFELDTLSRFCQICVKYKLYERWRD